MQNYITPKQIIPSILKNNPLQRTASFKSASAVKNASDRKKAELFSSMLQKQQQIQKKNNILPRFQNPDIVNQLEKNNIPSSRVVEDFNIKEDIQKSPQKKKLWNASQEMEAIFIQMMLKEMRKTLHKTKLIDGGRTEEIFTDFIYEERAKQMAKEKSYGIAENLYKSLSPNL